VITVTDGIGTGRTPLSAFDAALAAAGVANFNLVQLSSVIPADATVLVGRPDRGWAGSWGDRLYCVYAYRTAVEPAEQAWAGIGWVVAADGSGRGLFVEHADTSEDAVRTSIEASLADLVATRGGGFGEPQVRVRGTACVSGPATAVVIASYRADGWCGTDGPCRGRDRGP
jgi:arginine decarboxylase